MKLKIFLEGQFNTEPRVNNNGTVDFILIGDNKDIVFIRFTKDQYKQYKQFFNDDKKKVRIIGELKLEINKKNKPFMFVSPKDIEFVKIKNKSDIKKIKNNIKSLQERAEKQRWWTLYDEDDFIKISSDKINITQDFHRNGTVKFELDFEKGVAKGLHVVVRKLDNDEYELVSGIKALSIAKILGLEVNALVTDMAIDEFKNKYINPNIY